MPMKDLIMVGFVLIVPNICYIEVSLLACEWYILWNIYAIYCRYASIFQVSGGNGEGGVLLLMKYTKFISDWESHSSL